jgi:hypothetical protein
MKESVTYQAIIEEGYAKGRLLQARKSLLRLGELKFGEPASESARATVEAIDDVDLLEQLIGRVLRMRPWDELLADVPVPKPRRRRVNRR